MSEELHKLEAQRRANRDAAAALGLHPYGSRVDGIITNAAARALHSETADQEVKVALYQWWIEPTKDSTGKPVPDVIPFSISFS